MQLAVRDIGQVTDIQGLAIAGAEPVGLGSGFEEVGVEGDPVDDRDHHAVSRMGAECDVADDRGHDAGVGEDGSPLAEREVGPDRDRCSFLLLGTVGPGP